MPCAPIPDQPVLFPNMHAGPSSSKQEIRSQYSHPDCGLLSLTAPCGCTSGTNGSPRVGPMCFVTVTSDCPFFAEHIAWIPVCQMGRKFVFPFCFTAMCQEITVHFLPCVFLLAAGTQVHEPGGRDCAVHNPGPGDGEAGQVQRSREVSFFQYW